MSVSLDIEKKLGNFHLKVNFSGENEVIALLGASGSGKSMTLKCIAGIEKPDKGRIIVDGVTLSPAEKPTKHGLIFAATPASDIVCGPSQVASGIGLQVFMTGQGTPYGLDVASGLKEPYSDQYGFHNDMCIFNPAPIT